MILEQVVAELEAILADEPMEETLKDRLAALVVLAEAELDALQDVEPDAPEDEQILS